MYPIEEIVKRHEDRLLRTALAIMGSKADAEDAVQEAFIKVIEKKPRFQSEEHEKAWFIRVTVNICRSRLRSYWRRNVEPLEDGQALAPSDGGKRDIIESVFSLPPKYRAVIHLYYYEGYSTKEIAGLTGQRDSTVRSLLTRARRMLKEALEAEDV